VPDEPRYWYAARAHRWGYRRAQSWQGWLFDIGVFVTCIAISPYVREPAHPFKSLGLFFGLLVLFLAVRYWKGEPNSWDE